jgi:pilus assembly protein Flp/PilA
MQEEGTMTTLTNAVMKCQVWRDTRGQELVEYALMAGFLVSIASVCSPTIASNIGTIFGQVLALLNIAGSSDFAAPRS